MTTSQNTISGPETLTWKHDRQSGSYYAQDRQLGMAAEVGRSGQRWFVRVWPAALAPCPDRYVRFECGIRTMKDARAMAARTPCFRCGRGRPLILMERYIVRWRCIDHAPCEAERARLQEVGAGFDPLDAQAYQARTGSARVLAGMWALEYRKAAIRCFGIRNTRDLPAADAAACRAEADAALAGRLANVIPLAGRAS